MLSGRLVDSIRDAREQQGAHGFQQREVEPGIAAAAEAFDDEFRGSLAGAGSQAFDGAGGGFCYTVNERAAGVVDQ